MDSHARARLLLLELIRDLVAAGALTVRAHQIHDALRKNGLSNQAAVLILELEAGGIIIPVDTAPSEIRPGVRGIADMLLRELGPSLWRIGPGAFAALRTATPSVCPAGDRQDGPCGGRWVRVNGKRHDVPAGTIYRFIDHMWSRDWEDYDALMNGAVFETVVEPQTIRSKTSKVNAVLKRIGITWRLQCDSEERKVTKTVN